MLFDGVMWRTAQELFPVDIAQYLNYLAEYSRKRDINKVVHSNK